MSPALRSTGAPGREASPALGRPRLGARARTSLLAGALALSALAPPTVGAESWGGITPAETSKRDLQARYGPPSRERSLVQEGKTVAEWTYTGDRAPTGTERMVISFGYILPSGFTPDVVRSITLYPKPRLFPVQVLVDGYGKPDVLATEESTGRPAMRYEERGLFIVLDSTGRWAEMIFLAPGVRRP